MEINDEHIKSLISSYQETGESFSSILEHLSLFIYYFPRLLSHSNNEDLFGDYYNYFLQRLPKVLSSYTSINGILFKTWFYLVQKRHYLNFLKANKRASIEQISDYMESFSLDIVGNTSLINPDTLSNLSLYLTEDEILFVKLFAPDNLNKEDFKMLMRMLDCSLETLMLKIRVLFDYTSEYEGKKLIKLVSINQVAEFLGWNRLKVSKKIHKIREKMQKTYIWED